MFCRLNVMKKLFIIVLVSLAVLPMAAQQRRQQHGQGIPEDSRKQQEEMMEKMKKEAAVYYADADTADYGVRYRFKMLFDRENNLRYEEDRVVLVTDSVTLDMSYEGIGETRWRLAGKQGGDPSLAYRLTPSYYFYYPYSDRLVKTYRVISDDILISERRPDNRWTITDETRTIAGYGCRKATATIAGRNWTAWFTTALKGKAAPRHLTGLPGVVLEATDDTGDMAWTFTELVKSEPESVLFIKFPSGFTPVAPDKIDMVLKIFGISNNNYIEQSGLNSKSPSYYPEKLRPSTGIDACRVTNPIEL